MGSDQDRATVRSRLVTASETAVPRTAAESHSDGSAFDAADERAPGWLFERGDAPEQDEPTSFSPRSRLALGRRGAAVLVLAGLIAAGVAGVAVVRDRPTAQAVPPLPVVEVREPEAVGDEEPAAGAGGRGGTRRGRATGRERGRSRQSGRAGSASARIQGRRRARRRGRATPRRGRPGVETWPNGSTTATRSWSGRCRRTAVPPP